MLHYSWVQGFHHSSQYECFCGQERICVSYKLYVYYVYHRGVCVAVVKHTGTEGEGDSTALALVLEGFTGQQKSALLQKSTATQNQHSATASILPVFITVATSHRQQPTLCLHQSTPVQVLKQPDQGLRPQVTDESM